MRAESFEKALVYSIWAGFFLLLLMPAVISTQTIFPFIVGKALYGRILASLIFMLWLPLAFKKASYRPRRSWILIIFAFYILVALISGLQGVSLERSLWSTFERMQGIVDLAHWFVILIVMTSILRKSVELKYLLNTNLAVSVLISIIGLGEYFDIEWMPYYEVLNNRARLGITFGNPSFAASYMMVNVLIGIGLLCQSFYSTNKTTPNPTPSQRQRKRRGRRRNRQEERSRDIKVHLWRSFWAIAIILDFWVMTLTGTRGAAIGLAAGLIILAIGYIIFSQHTKLKITGSATLAAFIVIAGLVIVFRNSQPVESLASRNILVERLTNLNSSQLPFQSRLLTLQVGMRAFSEKPLLGWGAENYIVAYGRHYQGSSQSYEMLDHAHNKPVEELVTKGFFGLVSYLSIWLLMAIYIFKSLPLQKARDQILTLSISSALAAYFIQNLFLFDTPVSTLQWIILISFVINLEYNYATHKVLKTDSHLLKDNDTPRFSIQKYLSKILVQRIVSVHRRANAAKIAIIFASVIIATASLLLSLRAFNTSSDILAMRTGMQGADGIINAVGGTIKSNQPLGNYSRLVFFENVPKFLHSLPEEDSKKILVFARHQASESIKSEPENWLIYLTVAKMYLDLAEQRPSYMYVDAARPYLSKAVEFAPERPDVSIATSQAVEIEKWLLLNADLEGGIYHEPTDIWGVSFDFDGIDSKVVIKDHSELQNIFDVGGGVKILVQLDSSSEGLNHEFLKEVAFGDHEVIIEKGGEESNSGFDLRCSNPTETGCALVFTMQFSEVDGQWKSPNDAIKFQKPQSIDLSYDTNPIGQRPILKIDGSKVELTEISTPKGTRISDENRDIIIGSNSSGNNTLDGKVYALSLYKDTYNSSPAAYITYWTFAEGQGMRINDTAPGTINHTGIIQSGRGSWYQGLTGVDINDFLGLEKN